MDIIYIALLTLVSGTIGTMTGFGTSTIMLPILVMFMPPIEAIFLVSIIHWFGNLWRIMLFKSGLNLKLFALFGISGLVASYAGASLSLKIDGSFLLRLLGIFLAIYSLSLIFKSHLKITAGTKTALFGGTLSGFFAGIFGIGGAIRSAFLLVFDLPKAVYIATAAAIGLLVDSTRVITYYWGGTQMSERLWWGLLIFIPVSLSGAQIAKIIVNKIPQDKFRIVIAVFLLFIGIKLLLWPV
jgi:uncharacterized membrane protein YfcA